jgi:hypothetical protein
MKTHIIRMGGLALLAVVLAASCSKQAPAPASGNSASADQATSPASPTPAPDGSAAAAPSPPVAAAPENGDINTLLAQLTVELRKYVFRTRAAPKNFEEFVANDNLQVPAPPDGQKYAIQQGRVVLVKR